MNYCIKCSKVLINRINFTEARVAQMDSNKYIYFCDDCGKLIDSGYFENCPHSVSHIGESWCDHERSSRRKFLN